VAPTSSLLYSYYSWTSFVFCLLFLVHNVYTDCLRLLLLNWINLLMNWGTYWESLHSTEICWLSLWIDLIWWIHLLSCWNTLHWWLSIHSWWIWWYSLHWWLVVHSWSVFRLGLIWHSWLHSLHWMLSISHFRIISG